MSTIIPEDKHRKTLETCVDVPEEPPSFPIRITKVGISGKTVWVRLTDHGGGYLPFKAKILVDLDAKRRGIHMSRIEQEITSLHDRQFNSLPEYGNLLSSRVLARQNARSLSLELTGQLPFIQQTPVTKINSIDSIEVSCKTVLEAKKTGKSLQTEIGIGMHHLTACPCTISYNEALFNRFNDSCPQATHSQ
ncbi:MAG: GTP cyclohydrolase, FolE2/MptA family, partial [Desulfobulbales bacterium]|nr:GTP cyclohydrolase, FolE2/MptA family [Desulfobulbales bacterium]